VAPFDSFILLGLEGVSEAHTNFIVLKKRLFDGFHYGGLRLLLGEVVDN
jgi:hypothetical protein